MAKLLKSPVRRRVRRWLGTLFREARRLERRRRLRYAGGVAPACGIATGGGFLIANHGEPSPGSGDDPAVPLVSSLALPKAGDYFALATVGDHIILSGGPTGSLFPSGSTTLLSDGRVVGTCDAATVEPGTLRLGRVAHANSVIRRCTASRPWQSATWCSRCQEPVGSASSRSGSRASIPVRSTGTRVRLVRRREHHGRSR